MSGMLESLVAAAMMQPNQSGGDAISWNDLVDRPFDEPTGDTTSRLIFDEVIVTAGNTFQSVPTAYAFPTKGDVRVGYNYNEYAGMPIVLHENEYRGEYYTIGDPTLSEYPFYIDGHPNLDNCQVKVKNANDAISLRVIEQVYTCIPAKFLPKATAVADVTAAPTADKFNALLDALRNAGYLAT